MQRRDGTVNLMAKSFEPLRTAVTVVPEPHNFG